MRQRRAQKILNPEFPPSDPRRWEPGPQSTKRSGANWRERWYATLNIPEEELDHGERTNTANNS